MNQVLMNMRVIVHKDESSGFIYVDPDMVKLNNLEKFFDGRHVIDRYWSFVGWNGKMHIYKMRTYSKTNEESLNKVGAWLADSGFSWSISENETEIHFILLECKK